MLGRLSGKMNSDRLAAFAKYMTKTGLGESPYPLGHNMIYRQLCDLFRAEQYTGNAPCVAACDHYFPGIQVFVARKAENDESGLIVAGKGGTNDESHNHNDIGNYAGQNHLLKPTKYEQNLSLYNTFFSHLRSKSDTLYGKNRL
ncbi:hypothetical protein AGMMS49992_20480 [Clostridia bacterium]|nr:hypothetical protein AGMMS49992_20480 [Clostridia bacterium]